MSPTKSRDTELPDLTFPKLKVSPSETPPNLAYLLYLGGAGTHLQEVARHVANGKLGKPLIDRLELVQKIHEYFSGQLTRGGSRRTLRTNLDALRRFFRYVDESGNVLNLATTQQRYMEWTDSLLEQVRVKKNKTEKTAYHEAANVGSTLDAALMRARPMVKLCRLKYVRRITAATNKQDLTETFRFGKMLHDICTGLTSNEIRGPFPIRLRFQGGEVIEKWGQLKATKSRTCSTVWDAHNKDKSLKYRSPLVNLRMEAELLMFIAQTGMNLEQASSLQLNDFSYTSTNDGYQVRHRKNRRGGDVEFEIFRDYRAHFEAYLAWRREIFSSDEDMRLFPFIQMSKFTHTRQRHFAQIVSICQELKLRFFGPQILRKTRTNFLLRELGDQDLVAAMGQHSSQTLLRHYIQPNHQIAIVEIHRFHQKNDPALAPPGPGVCISAQPLPTEPSVTAPAPDCVNAAGCLFCSMQRDVDTLDYVWSLTSFRHLKSLEIATNRTSGQNTLASSHPAHAVVDRITQKLNWFKQSSQKRRGWALESTERIAEGHYHPMWNGFIQLRELDA